MFFERLQVKIQIYFDPKLREYIDLNVSTIAHFFNFHFGAIKSPKFLVCFIDCIKTVIRDSIARYVLLGASKVSENVSETA